ncbi:Endonuclease/exonuclease/phosphatase [Absidia repens]|uniref:Endonuclease/exonuclease/phosphatase n=1 Tax=Absidia repens TaxID=90262 RepID=A0A1X2HZP9_9FUNG|nr:Endonuclease/exonuclease/phosphatase [Absidia repens]
MAPNTLSVLSLNCWGLYIVSKKRKFRLESIAKAINQASYDIVTLQEIWVQDDFQKIKACLATKLPYAKYFYSGALGSGLAIFSKFPIIQTSYFRYSLAGRPLKVFHGDYYVGKGCATVCLEHPIAGLIQVFTTHLHAGYGNSDEYQGHRITESWELANLLRSAAAQGRQIIVTGDFNSVPTSYNYRILMEHAFMTDSWLEVHSGDDDGNWESRNQQRLHDDDPDSFIQQFGITCNSSSNTWSKHFRGLSQETMQQRRTGDRLDYIFYRRTSELRCTESFVVMTERIPGTNMSYSDHYGVQSNFIVSGGDDDEQMLLSTENMATMNNHDSGIRTHLFGGNNSLAMTQPSSFEMASPTYTNLDLTTVQELIIVLQKDQQAMRRTAQRLLRCFMALVGLVIILYIVIVVVPYRVTISIVGSWHRDNDMLIIWLLPLLVGIPLIVCSVLAMVCLIVGFVFGYGEQQTMHQHVTDLQTLLHGIQLRNRTPSLIPRS